MRQEWASFKGGVWEKEINVRDFIQKNYTPYEGDETFLEGPTKATNELWEQVMELTEEERNKGGVLDMDTHIISTITSHGPGYLNKDKEKIVGFQTDKPFKRALQPNGGIRMAIKACEDNGYHVDPEIVDFYTKYRKTHNDGVFDVYSPEMRACRSSHIITGLPDAYGRGRIIGDYRRVALYGVDRLIEDKEDQKAGTRSNMYEDVIRNREELSEQIKALKELKKLGEIYGFDISRPAQNVQEAIQWLYFGYLAAIKEQNGAAMSLGRTSTFLDIYAERDLANGTFTEEQIQEFIDHFIMKLRLVKFARTPEYNALFSGDPTWVTESIAGMGIDGRSMVTKMSYRYLHTLSNLGPAPEPNLTVLWSTRLPQNFKRFCAKTSIASSSIQYENDDLMRVTHGDDYAIACCVSSMRVGKEMQFFGARANLAKCLLYAINGGVDEITKKQVGPKYRPITSEYLDYDEVMERYDDMSRWLSHVYVNTLNIIHYMHDKYCYERLQMALHDKNVTRWFATGIAGLSVIADSLSAIKYAKVKTIRDENGIVVDFEVEGDYPKYGNDDDRVDEIAYKIVKDFMHYVGTTQTYRGGIPTTSILTITSNVVYGKNTGATPDGRKAGEPFAPGANPMHGRDSHGAVASLSSVAKLPFKEAQDGISNTFSIIPGALGKEDMVMLDSISLDDLSFSLEPDCACCEPNLSVDEAE
ncbi:formate C-acetyltransferase [Blautia sp.]|jgi:formate C-acetyltransferase|uniref:formate C-acetyltransferase n=1 Tax=Blautia sp. TaxID=1955243 RepID=UPI00280B901E|nr:formate C-acetyltransferase [Blautia sp.]MED9881460.1 formate C-acetyltransferase [Blautia sp.]